MGDGSGWRRNVLLRFFTPIQDTIVGDLSWDVRSESMALIGVDGGCEQTNLIENHGRRIVGVVDEFE